MKKILNIAHRGYTRHFPDNTLEAFGAALELGMDGVEFDVQETLDGNFIIHHDDDIGGKPILKYRLTELQPERIQGKYTIPLLHETLDLLNKKAILVIELKQIASLDKFLEILRSHADTERMGLVSFNAEIILLLARLAPEIKRAALTSAPANKLIEAARATRSDAISIHYSLLTPPLIAEAHASSLMTFVWGCTDLHSVRTALKFDIDGIISDFPDVVKHALSLKE